MSFSDHVELLQEFVRCRREIVEAIDGRALNARVSSSSPTRHHFEHLLNACFFNTPGIPRGLSRLKGQLAAAHLADGFEPVRLDNFSHELDPVALIGRAHHHWAHHRYPGKSGRTTFAQTIYAVFMLRALEHLSLRIWDEGFNGASARLDALQRLLDQVNAATGANVLVRAARWLMQTAQGPLTRHLLPYFRVAERISASLSDAQRLECHLAGAVLAGGHLRSQLRYRVWRTGRPIDDPEQLAFMRDSNSMDAALLVRDLVPLLTAYTSACREHAPVKLDLADAILQGLSADPELFVARLDLLAPCTMIEHLFIECGGNGGVRSTALGEAHVAVLAQYGRLLSEAIESLTHDASMLDPAQHRYSPYAISYGFVSDLLSNMALDALHAHPTLGLSLEDVFVAHGGGERQLARARGWQSLPVREGEREHFDHSPEWAAQVHARLLTALNARASRPAAPNASAVHDARLFVVSDGESAAVWPHPGPPAGIATAQEYCFTSDLQRAASDTVTVQPKSHMVNDRNEARFLASAESRGKWFGISKIILTMFTGQGKDVLVAGVPPEIVGILRLTCPDLIVVAPDDVSRRAS